MAVAICSKCRKYIPDGFHYWTNDKICNCKTKEEWIKYYKKNKWFLKIDGETYDFTKR